MGASYLEIEHSGRDHFKEIDLSENERTDRQDGGAEAELRPERLRLSLQAGAQQRGSQAVSREGSWEGEGDDGAGEQAQGGERDARGQDQAPIKGADVPEGHLPDARRVVARPLPRRPRREGAPPQGRRRRGLIGNEPAQLDGVGQLRAIVTPGEPLKEDVMHFLLMPMRCLQKEGHSLRERKTSLLSRAPSTVKT